MHVESAADKVAGETHVRATNLTRLLFLIFVDKFVAITCVAWAVEVAKLIHPPHRCILAASRALLQVGHVVRALVRANGSLIGLQCWSLLHVPQHRAQQRQG